MSKKEWETTVSVINQSFWEYVKVLEEATQKLFEYMNTVDLNGWSMDFYQIASSFKELLSHRVEDLIWVYKRVESLLLAYKWICSKQKNVWIIFGKILRFFSHGLDKALLVRLHQIDESLTTHFKAFEVSYRALSALIPEIQEKESAFARFPVFMQLEGEKRNQIIQLYRLVSLDQKNAKLKTLNEELLIKTVENLAKPGLMTVLFRDYIDSIKKTFFHYCVEWQKKQDRSIKKNFSMLFEEMHLVKEIIESYRNMLKLHTRKWGIGREPRKTVDLLHLIDQIESIESLFLPLVSTLDKKPLENASVKKDLIKEKIEEVLREMGQPLLSRNLIQEKGEKLIELLDSLDEIGGSLGDVHAIIREVLLKAMHYDAKYQVLSDYPRFHELYLIHQGLNPMPDNREHEARLRLFQLTIKHLELWSQNKTVEDHIGEIEQEEASVHEALQSFLGLLQRDSHVQENRIRYEEMLLEYRYLFSQFFHFLRTLEGQGVAIRAQFAFVDRYLEAIELQLVKS